VHTDDLEFEWDAEKDRANRKKHGFRLAEAATVFMDERALLMEDENPFEERFIAIGKMSTGEIVLVSFTWRREKIRLISARKANVLERQQYEKGQ
jgi:uncharacterized DUF497 family protein